MRTGWASTHHVNRRWTHLTWLVAVMLALDAAGVAGMAYIAGFGAVWRRLGDAHLWWLAPAAGGVVIAFAGYFTAYRGIKRVEGGPDLDSRSLLAVVAAGYGGFLAHGGGALDEFAMRAGGEEKRQAKVRVSALAGFENGVLALIACPASIVAVALGVAIPRASFTWPWAAIPPLGFALAIWAAERYRERLRTRDGWRAHVGIFYDAVHLVWILMRRPLQNGAATFAMALYWGAEMFILWAATAAFGLRMSALCVIVALATGMLVTRRIAPLGGAGVLTLALVPTLRYGAAVPFAAAALGVAVYRALTVWLPLPPALLALSALRTLVDRSDQTTGPDTSGTGPALR